MKQRPTDFTGGIRRLAPRRIVASGGTILAFPSSEYGRFNSKGARTDTTDTEYWHDRSSYIARVMGLTDVGNDLRALIRRYPISDKV